jgi:hypothetical protein
MRKVGKMDELKAWAEQQVEIWKLQTESLTGGKMRVEELDSGKWVDITPLATAQVKESTARLRSILGRIEAGVVTGDASGEPQPQSGGLD